jgi:hypothetical protein
MKSISAISIKYKFLTDIFHFLCGVLTYLLLLYEKFIPAGFILLAVYVVYQLMQSRSDEELAEDLLEYIGGVVACFGVQMMLSLCAL